MSNWSNLHEKYSQKDWSKLPSIFATEAIEYFPAQGTLLELGTGVGQDGLYFAEHGYEVTATDVVVDKISKIIAEKSAKNIKAMVADLQEPLSFDDESYDIVYAHLSLHYFDSATTARIFDDIYRVLKPGGTFALFTNSTSDPEYGTGTKLEDDYYLIEGVAKRYFTVDTLKPYLDKFKIQLLDNNGETYKDKAIGVHNLIRAIVTKP